MNDLNDEQLEQATLTILVNNNAALFKIIRMFNPEVFYEEKHKVIARAIHNLADKGLAYDFIDVTHECKKLHGDNELMPYIASLNSQYVSAASIEYKYLLLSQLWIKRELIRSCEAIILDTKSAHTDIWDLFDKADNKLKAIQEQYNVGNDVTHAQAIKRTYDDIMLGFEGKKKTFWSSGYPKIDQLLMMSPGNLLLMGGKSGKQIKFAIFA